jgi:hypothetical protein
VRIEIAVRTIASVVLGIVVIAGCTSSTDGNAGCPITGTYAVAGATESGNCASQSTDESGSTSTTYTITRRAEGSSPEYAIEIQGLQGACGADHVDTCKLHGKCDILIKDAVSATNNTGTFQFSWTFDAKGFGGTYALTVPPAKSLPKGCTENGTTQGTRR